MGKNCEQRNGEKNQTQLNIPRRNVGGEQKIGRQSSEKNYENAALKVSAQNSTPKQRRRQVAKGAWPVMICRCQKNASDGKLLVRASATIFCVRKGTSLRNPARTSSRTKCILMLTLCCDERISCALDFWSKQYRQDCLRTEKLL